MHELSIAQEIYEICRETLKRKGPGRLEGVKVSLGELSGVEPDLLKFAWEAITSDGEDSDSILEIEWHPARQFCPSCDESKPRSDGSWFPFCPDCLKPLRVEEGNELDFLSVTFTPLGN